jgi:hypothetical protein
MCTVLRFTLLGLAISLLNASCGDPTDRPDGSSDLSVSACSQPLADGCRDRPCPTTFAKAEAEARATPCLCFWSRSIESCGAYKVISEGSGAGGTSTFFDDAGTFVGMRFGTDTNSFCGGTSFYIDVGMVPDCTPTLTETLCGIDFGCAPVPDAGT